MEIYIVGNLKQYIFVFFLVISNQDFIVGGCMGVDINKMFVGNKGNVCIYIIYLLVGEIIIFEMMIMNFYLLKMLGSSGDNIFFFVLLMVYVIMFGIIIVLQFCFINVGQVIEVRLLDIEGKDICNFGDSLQNLYVIIQVNFICSNVVDGINLLMLLNGVIDLYNLDYLKIDNENLGIWIFDKYDKIIVFGGSVELLIEDYIDGKGSIEFIVVLVNIIGYVFYIGEYQVIVMLEIQIC